MEQYLNFFWSHHVIYYWKALVSSFHIMRLSTSPIWPPQHRVVFKHFSIFIINRPDFFMEPISCSINIIYNTWNFKKGWLHIGGVIVCPPGGSNFLTFVDIPHVKYITGKYYDNLFKLSTCHACFLIYHHRRHFSGFY